MLYSRQVAVISYRPLSFYSISSIFLRRKLIFIKYKPIKYYYGENSIKVIIKRIIYLNDYNKCLLNKLQILEISTFYRICNCFILFYWKLGTTKEILPNIIK